MHSINLGDLLHDFFVGVTMDDITSPEPGKYPLCLPQQMGKATTGQILDLKCDSGVQGRYVWLQVPGTESEILNICELEVY